MDNKIGQKKRQIFLKQQLEAIKKELGESEGENNDLFGMGTGKDPEITELKNKINAKNLPVFFFFS